MRGALGLILVLCALCLPPACREADAGRGRSQGLGGPVDPTAEDYRASPLPSGRVVLRDAFGGAHVVEVEVAATTHSRTRGLMWRRQLAPGRGMLFVFAEDEEHSFWMKNTLIPLDMLFIERGGTIVELVQNTEPRALTSYGGRKPCRYVLEVPGGWTEKAGIMLGSQVALHLPPGLEVEP